MPRSWPFVDGSTRANLRFALSDSDTVDITQVQALVSNDPSRGKMYELVGAARIDASESTESTPRLALVLRGLTIVLSTADLRAQTAGRHVEHDSMYQGPEFQCVFASLYVEQDSYYKLTFTDRTELLLVCVDDSKPKEVEVIHGDEQNVSWSTSLNFAYAVERVALWNQYMLFAFQDKGTWWVEIDNQTYRTARDLWLAPLFRFGSEPIQQVQLARDGFLINQKYRVVLEEKVGRAKNETKDEQPEEEEEDGIKKSWAKIDIATDMRQEPRFVYLGRAENNEASGNDDEDVSPCDQKVN